MHPNPKRVLPIILVLALAGFGWWYFTRPAVADTGALTASGTIEAVTVNISPEVGGRVTAVNAGEGSAVKAGDVLVTFDTRPVEAQQAQAAAAVTAVQATARAADAAKTAASANYALLKAGPTPQQLALAQTGVDRAQVILDAAQAAYDDLPLAARDTPGGIAVQQQLDLAKVGLANAKAQYDVASAGPRPEQLAAAQAQVDAAQAQLEAAQAQAAAAEAAVKVLDIQLARLTLTAPVDGVVFARTIEPGEVASPGATLLVVGKLDTLDITVFVPEDRYGNVQLGETATVAVDSFPGRVFNGTVTHIAEQAEFTPRNVQTAQGRKTTVFAVKLAIANPDGKLKPGMPADVKFGQ
jgi:HlyD family secretion protein